MANYSLVFKKSVAKELRSLPCNAVKHIIECIESLRENPRSDGCIKLSNKERYRIRQENYRILYEIKDTELIVTVVKVSHRKNVYKGS